MGQIRTEELGWLRATTRDVVYWLWQRKQIIYWRSIYMFT